MLLGCCQQVPLRISFKVAFAASSSALAYDVLIVDSLRLILRQITCNGYPNTVRKATFVVLTMQVEGIPFKLKPEVTD